MKALRGLLKMLLDLVTSKKFVTGALTAVATSVVDDPALATKIAAIGTAVVVGYAAQDAGKEKAKIQAEADLPEVTP